MDFYLKKEPKISLTDLGKLPVKYANILFQLKKWPAGRT